MDLSGVTVVLPALDEAAALPAALASFPPGIDLLVVDNGSSDDTAAVAAAAGARVVTEPRRGFGAACWAGVQASPRAEVLAFADADGSFDGADLEGVAGPVLRGQADLVVGSRTTGRREPGAMTALAVAANRALGRGVHDRGQGWPLEMVGRAGRVGLRVVEVPVGYRPRAGGASKVSGSLQGSMRAAAAMAAVTCRLLVERSRVRTGPGSARRPPTSTRFRSAGR
jgi:glycosyltransferase involved in cell wall biosynthesis